MFDTVMAFEASIIWRNCNYWNFRNTKATDTQTKQRSIENFRKKTWFRNEKQMLFDDREKSFPLVLKLSNSFRALMWELR